MKNTIKNCLCLNILIGALLCGCSTMPSHPCDPLEPLNRKIYAFNTTIDKVVYRPVAKTYSHITPKAVKKVISNFFNNLWEITTVANDLLQADLHSALLDSWRFVANSTFGVLGLFDIATALEVPAHYQDLGVTLAKWGIKNSPYIMLPFLGPTTFRDMVSLPVDYYFFSAWPYISSEPARYGLIALQQVNRRSRLLKTDRLVDSAFDPYAFVRDAYMQKRRELIDRKPRRRRMKHSLQNAHRPTQSSKESENPSEVD